MYNKLEDKCGIVFMSTDYIKRRIERGLRYQKPGYKEFYSRIGRKYFELEETTANDADELNAGALGSAESLLPFSLERESIIFLIQDIPDAQSSFHTCFNAVLMLF